MMNDLKPLIALAAEGPLTRAQAKPRSTFCLKGKPRLRRWAGS